MGLRRWRLDKGEYPEKLPDLMAEGYLKALPQDPYSEGALKYERRGNDFVLYSLGADCSDDGGWRNPQNSSAENEGGGDRVFWPVQ